MILRVATFQAQATDAFVRFGALHAEGAHDAAHVPLRFLEEPENLGRFKSE